MLSTSLKLDIPRIGDSQPLQTPQSVVKLVYSYGCRDQAMDSDDENLVIPHGAHAVLPRDPALAGAVMPSELGYETEWDAFQLSIARYEINETIVT